MNQWAITVGINQYRYFQPLGYAQRDAQALRQFLIDEAGFSSDRCLLLTETSPAIGGKSTYPTREAIQSWIDLLRQQYIQPGDGVWFFFSGYGICYQGQDYLVPIDGEPTAIQATAISLEEIYRQLKMMLASSMLVLLDINRSEGILSNETVGVQTVRLADQTQIPTILSCQPGQFSREAAALGQGFFTAALLESLRYPQCATLENLNRFLSDRLPQLSEHYWRPVQQPLMISPPEKIHQVILPHSYRQQGVAINQAATSSGGSSLFDQPEVPGYDEALHRYTENCSGPDLTAFDVEGLIGPWEGTKSETQSSPQSGNLGSCQTEPPASKFDVSELATVFPGPRAADQASNGSASAHSSVSSQSAPLSIPTESRGDSSLQEISDALFWRPAVMWGGLAVSALFLGVLLRNWTAITQGNPPTPQPTQVALNAPQASPPTNSPVPPAGDRTVPSTTARSQAAIKSSPISIRPATPPLDFAPPQNPPTSQPPSSPTLPNPGSAIVNPLAKARALVKSEQASPYRAAIREATKIRPGHPQYQEAQQEIAAWSKEILRVAQQRAKQKRFDGAVLAAALVPSNQPIVVEAKGAIAWWCSILRRRPGGSSTQYQQARAICRKQTGR